MADRNSISISIPINIPINIPGATLHIIQQGRGVPVVFVHGFPLNHEMWGRQLNELADCCRVIAIDLRGFGASTPATPLTDDDVLSLDQHADDIANVLDALGIHEPIVLCGLSMGGYVGWSFVRRHAARLRALIACDTRAAVDSAEGIANRHRLAASVLEHGSEVIAAAMLPKLVSANTNETHPEIVTQLRSWILSTAPRTIAAAQRGMALRSDATSLLPTIQVPTLIVCGAEDTISPPQEMQSISTAIPNSRFVSIPDAGHMSPLEQPTAVNAALREFLSSLR